MPENGGFEKEVRLFNFTNRIRIKQSELLLFFNNCFDHCTFYDIKIVEYARCVCIYNFWMKIMGWKKTIAYIKHFIVFFHVKVTQ